MSQGNSRRGGKEAGSGRSNPRRPIDRSTTVSKKLSWLLRHGAKSVGVKMNSGGWVNIEDALKWKEFQKLEATFDEIKEVTGQNEKKRFQIAPASAFQEESVLTTTDKLGITDLITLDPESPNDASKHLIRATQGHSMKDVQAADLLTPITEGEFFDLVQVSDDIPSKCPELVVHGTTLQAWNQIEKSGGLKPMSRQHVHFAARPSGSGEKVISGMRAKSTILIWVDLRRSLAEMKWWLSANGVILTDGTNRLIPLKFIDRVEQREEGSAEAKVIWTPQSLSDGGI